MGVFIVDFFGPGPSITQGVPPVASLFGPTNCEKNCWSVARSRDILKSAGNCATSCRQRGIPGTIGSRSSVQGSIESFVGPRSWVRWAGMDPGGTDNLGITRLVAVQRKHRDTERGRVPTITRMVSCRTVNARNSSNL